MARTVATVQTSGRSASETITFQVADTSNGNYFDNNSQQVLLIVNNVTAGAAVATIGTPVTIDGLALPDLAVTVAAGDIAVIGPFSEANYSQEDVDSGTVHAVFVDVDVVAEIAAVRYGPLGG